MRGNGVAKLRGDEVNGCVPGCGIAVDADAFSSKKWWARSLVLLAGVTMNFLLAIVIFFIFLISGASPIGPNLLLDKDYNSYFLPSFDRAVESGYIQHE